MPNFLYFIPFGSVQSKQTVEPSDLRKLGLGHVLLPGVAIRFVPLTGGPGGLDGLLCQLDTPNHPPLTYVADKQRWRSGPKGAYFVGMGSYGQPGPADLARPVQFGGSSVRLLDGNEWLIPRCAGLVPDRPSTLPYLIDLDEDGETTVAGPHPEFESISRRAFDFWLMFRGAENAPQMTVADLSSLAVDALSVNYRIGKVEALGLLKLLSVDERSRILRAMIDADEIEAYFRVQSANANLPAASEKKDTSLVSG